MILNGIEVMFYVLGIATALGVMLIRHYAKSYALKWSSWLVGLFALFFALFTIAWSWSSVLEKESQAAGMGLLFFGIPAVILVFLTRRMVLKSEKKVAD